MKSNNVDLRALWREIYQRQLMQFWADGLFVKSEEEGNERAQRKAEEAKTAYARIMSSKKNDGSFRYQQWALGKALGVDINGTTTGYQTKTSNRRRNRGLS